MGSSHKTVKIVANVDNPHKAYVWVGGGNVTPNDMGGYDITVRVDGESLQFSFYETGPISKEEYVRI